MTVTHTIGVFALGLVTLGLSQFIVPEQLYPWLNLASGAARRSASAFRCCAGAGSGTTRARTRTGITTTTTTTTHEPTRRAGAALLAVGISGGLLPCPSALVVLLAAISLHRVALGLLLIVAFSVGLAALDHGHRPARRPREAGLRAASSFDGRVVRALLPAVSALVIVVAGVGDDRPGPPESEPEHVRTRRLPRNLSDGATLLVVLGVALLLGLRHATDPDHLAAVTTLARRRPSGARGTPRGSASPGAPGHALTLFAFGVPIVLYRAYLPERASSAAPRPRSAS